MWFKKYKKQICFLPKFNMNSSIYIYKTKSHCGNVKRLWYFTFLFIISFLVSCCCFCSFNSTENLTGLPWKLFSDWLNRRMHKRQLFQVKLVRKSAETRLFCFLLQLSLSQLVGRKLKPLALSSFPYSSNPKQQQKTAMKRALNSNVGQNGPTCI